MEQKLSLFGNLHSTSSKMVGWEEIVRLIQYDDGVRQRTEVYGKMLTALGKREADDKMKHSAPAFAVPVRFDGRGKQAQNVEGFTGLAMATDGRRRSRLWSSWVRSRSPNKRLELTSNSS